MKNNNDQGNLYILGAGGFAREIYSYLSESDFSYNGLSLAGFLDDDKNALEGFSCKHKIIGGIKSLSLSDNDSLILGVANPSVKELVFNFYNEYPGSIITYIHPSAIVGNNVTVGVGSVFAPYSVATTDVRIGRGCTINVFSTLGHDAELGDFCTLSGHCDVTGNAKLGSKVFMGSHSSVIPSTVVENNAVIGAGSLVLRKVKENTTVFGNPAKKIK